MLNLPLKQIVRHLESFQSDTSRSIDDLISVDQLSHPVSLDSVDYDLLRKEAFELGSSNRYLDLSLSEWIFKDTLDSNSSDKVLFGLFNSGRFRDVISFSEKFSSKSESSLQLLLASAYHLGDWSNVIKFSAQLRVDAISFDLVYMIARSHLEENNYKSFASLFEALSASSTSQQQQQLEVLKLLGVFSQGFASEDDVAKLLGLLPSLTFEEISWFVRFFPLVNVLVGSSDEIHRIIRRFWARLAESEILLDSHDPLSSLEPSKQKKRIGLIFDTNDIDSVSLAVTLRQELYLLDPEYELYSVFIKANSAALKPEQNQIFISSSTVRDRICQLRSCNFDVVIDTVGPQDPNWLLTAAQGIAPVQLAWFSSPFPIPRNSPYQGQLVDRWTSSEMPSTYDVACLKLSGIRQLAQPLRHDLVDTNSEPDPAALIVLGSSDTLLPDASLMFKHCLEDLNVKELLFVDPCWASQDLLSSWWMYKLSEPLPSRCKSSSLNSLPSNLRFIALDLNSLSPCKQASVLLGKGIPVVSLPLSYVSSRGTSGILSSLGLESLSSDDPDIWLQTVQALVDDFLTYDQISSHLKSSFSTSLSCNYQLFVRDLIEIISILESA